MEDIHKRLVRKYHTLCTALGMTQDERACVIAPYGVEHSTDLNDHDLLDICASLEAQVNERKARKDAELDKWRKRVMASIGAWLKSEGRFSDANIIKGIALRAIPEYTEFNKIPKQRLINLVYLFNNKVKDRQTPSPALPLNGEGEVTQKVVALYN